jgi:cystathionine beta-lyase
MADPALDLSVPDLPELQARRSEKWAVHDGDVLSLTVAEMDFPVAAPVRAAVHDAVDRSDLGYATPATPALTEALAGFAARRLGWTIDPEQVTVVADVMVGLVELCRHLVGPGEAVAFASPAYPPFFAELRDAERRLITVALGPSGRIDLEALDAALHQGARVLVLSNPHNPTGRVLPRDELQGIAERCAAARTWVLADEIHAPLVLPGATHTPWLEVSDAARACGIALTSASKAFNLAALKTAFVVTAHGTTREVVRRAGSQQDHASVLGEIAAEVAFRDCDDWLDEVIAQLDHNRAHLADKLSAHLPDIQWTPPQATYLAWLDCRRLSLGDDPAAVFLGRSRIALSRGLDFGPEGAGHVRLNFATSPAHISEAIRRMAQAVGRPAVS